LLNDLSVFRKGKDWYRRSVFGDKSGEPSSLSVTNNEINGKVEDSVHGRGSNSLWSLHGHGGEHFHVLVKSSMVQSALTLNTDFGKGSDGDDRELSFGGFVKEHDGVNSVDDGLADISSLTTSRLGHAGHGV
jgi:hypothetical protein